MTININIKSNIDQVTKDVGRFYARQVPFAASVAMNQTAVDVQKAEQAAMPRELDNPRASTIKGIRVSRSNKRNLVASVFVIPHIDKFLRFQIEGGTRAPRGKAEAVPVEIRLNRYGNIPGRRTGKLQKLLSRPDTFSATIKGVPGIWQRGKGRNKGQLKLLVRYEDRVTYRPRFHFYRHAQRTAASTWPRNFNRSMRAAIKTAR